MKKRPSRTAPMPNALYYGDSLDILRQHASVESVDLVYSDASFNSSANYEVLFRECSGEESRRRSGHLAALGVGPGLIGNDWS